MEGACLDRGNCSCCGQRRILGYWLQNATQATFRCCACTDEFGTKVRHKKLNGCQYRGTQQTSRPTNWWAPSDAPPKLKDVPAGLLDRQLWSFSPSIGVQVFKEVVLETVLDLDHHFFSGHGARLWTAALSLAQQLCTEPGFVPGLVGLRVIELGAGCGLPGMMLARQGARVILTDVPWLTHLTQYNVEANFKEDDIFKPLVNPLRWGNQNDIDSVLSLMGRSPDLIIGADIVYREEDFGILLSTIVSLGARRALLAVTKRDYIVSAFIHKAQSLQMELQSVSSIDDVVFLTIRLPQDIIVNGSHTLPDPCLGKIHPIMDQLFVNVC